MSADEDRMRVATEARAATVSLTPVQVAQLRFVRENEDGTTVWSLVDSVAPGSVEVELGPGDLMRYGLTDRMREALAGPLAAPPAPGAHLSGAREGAVETQIERQGGQGADAQPPATEKPPRRVVQGSTDDGWRWSYVDDASGTLVAVDNKPQIDEARAAQEPLPEFQHVVVPLDVIELIARHA